MKKVNFEVTVCVPAIGKETPHEAGSLMMIDREGYAFDCLRLIQPSRPRAPPISHTAPGTGMGVIVILARKASYWPSGLVP